MDSSMAKDTVASATPSHMVDSTHTKTIWYAPHKFEAYGEEEIKAVEACLRDGWLAPGPRTNRFEDSVAKYFGKKFGAFAYRAPIAHSTKPIKASHGQIVSSYHPFLP